MLPESTPLDLASYRLSRAKDLLQDARLLFNADQWASANNRAYYSLFHALRAVLALQQMDFKKHSAVISVFHRDYINTGLIDKKYSSIITNASLIRNHSDYDDFYICSQEETSDLICDVQDFLFAIESYLQSQGCSL